MTITAVSVDQITLHEIHIRTHIPEWMMPLLSM